MTILNLRKTKEIVTILMRMKIELFVLSVALYIQMPGDYGFAVMAVMPGSTLNAQISRVKSMFQMSITATNVDCKYFSCLIIQTPVS